VAKILSLLVFLALLTGCQSLAHQDVGNPGPQATLSASPTSLSFGNVMVGSSASLKASLKAAGAPVTVSSVTSPSAEFTVSGISFPAALDTGQSLPYTVKFSPQSSGAASATLSFASNAENSPAIQPLDGTGTSAPQHSVDLSWNASQSAGVVGYNVYRGTGGPYSRINVSLEASTSYTDVAVSSGTTYYYVVTAVNNKDMESGYSAQAKAVVPTP
jgi:hypothetical protein